MGFFNLNAAQKRIEEQRAAEWESKRARKEELADWRMKKRASIFGPLGFLLGGILGWALWPSETVNWIQFTSSVFASVFGLLMGNFLPIIIRFAGALVVITLLSIIVFYFIWPWLWST